MTAFLLKVWKSFVDAVFPPRKNAELAQKAVQNIHSLKSAEAVYGFPWIKALFSYKDPAVKALIWELKYHRGFDYLSEIGQIFFEDILSIISDVSLFDPEAKFLLIPIPLSDLRRAERGYNQSEYICRAILENDQNRLLLYAPQWLSKIKETAIQSRSHSREDRMKNLRGCFRADNRVDGSYVILIDDVTTTGTTLSEARETLFASGAKDILAFTIAH